LRILVSWLHDFLSVGETPAELAHELTQRGVEAEVLLPLAPVTKRLTFGRVATWLGPAEAGARFEVEVEGKSLSLTSRAREIPDDFIVGCFLEEKSIPTLEELGLSPVRFPLVQPRRMSSDELAADAVVDFAVLSNRGDLLSHLGLAREVSAIDGRPLTFPPLSAMDASRRGDDAPSITLANPELCPRYVGTFLDVTQIAPSPDWMAYRLSLCGVSPLNNIVDLSNYILLELGQPLHTFDRSQLQGGIIVRNARPGEKFVAINHQEYELDDSFLVIADEEKPVALAGLMGGLNSEISETTRQVLLESAYFNPRHIRVESKRTGLASESSLRFGHGIDPEMPPLAARRFIHLAEETGAARAIDGSLVDAGEFNYEPPRIELPAGFLDRFLGVPFDRQQVAAKLELLGLSVESAAESIVASPPSWRHDLLSKEDIAEEVLRLNLFDSLPEIPPLIPQKHGAPERALAFEDAIADRLLHLGAQEIASYAFLSAQRAQLYWDDPKSLVAMQNPDSADQQYMTPTLLAGLISALARNLRHGENPPLLFELGRIFSRKPFASGESYLLHTSGGEEYHEQRALGVLFGADFIPPTHYPPSFAAASPFFVLKGVADYLLDERSAHCKLSPSPRRGLAEGRAFELRVGDALAGFIGEVSDHPRNEEGIEQTLAYMELSLDAIQPLTPPHPSFHAFSPYPRVERDLALVMPFETPAAEPQALIAEACGDELADVYPFDLYHGPQVPDGMKSIAYHLVFQHPERTLTGEEVDARILAALTKLYQQSGIVLRDFAAITDAKLFSDPKSSEQIKKLYGK